MPALDMSQSVFATVLFKGLISQAANYSSISKRTQSRNWLSVQISQAKDLNSSYADDFQVSGPICATLAGIHLSGDSQVRRKRLVQ